MDSGSPPSALLLLGLGCNSSCPPCGVCAAWMLGSQQHLPHVLVPSLLCHPASWRRIMEPQKGFNWKGPVWVWDWGFGAEQGRAGEFIKQQCLTALTGSYHILITKAIGTKPCCSLQCLSTSSDRLLKTSVSPSHTLVSWHYDFSADFPPPICSYAADHTTYFISGFTSAMEVQIHCLVCSFSPQSLWFNPCIPWGV